jgi:hypothetical protein
VWLSIEGNPKAASEKNVVPYIAAQHMAEPAAYQTRLSVNGYSSSSTARQIRLDKPHAHKGGNVIDDALIADDRFHLHAPSLAGASRGADYLRYASIITHCVAKARAGSIDFVSKARF